MAEGTRIKGKIACVIIVFAFSVVCLIGGIWQMGIYSDLKNNCTSEVTGIVVEKSFKEKDISSHSVETENITGRGSYRHNGYTIHIDVQTDDLFKTEDIYADIGTEKVGDTVIIHYSPDDPAYYYIGGRVNRYKEASIFSYVASGFMFVFSLFLVLFIRHSSKAEKATEV